MQIYLFFTKNLFIVLFLLICASSVIGQKPKPKRTIRSETSVNTKPIPDEKITVEKAKQPCIAKIADLPEIRGLRLGMTLSEMQDLFLRLQTERAGWSSLVVQATLRTPSYEQSLRGIKSFNAFFLQDKLASFRFEYEPEVKWNSIQEYAARLSENLKVSPDNWSYSSGYSYFDSLSGVIKKDGKKAELDCQDFSAEAELNSTYGLKVQIKDFYLKIVQAEKQIEDEKKKKFKP